MATLTAKPALAATTVASGPQPTILAEVHGASAAIWQRALRPDLASDVARLLASPFKELKTTAGQAGLASELAPALAAYPALLADVLGLVGQFTALAQTSEVRLWLAAVNSDMCRKFHTDITDFRLLCTYAGGGTYYVRPEHAPAKDKEPDPAQVEQLRPGEVMIFRGAMAATDECPPLLHRSPPAQGDGRLLLRLDTNGNHAWFLV
jgi:hypothetical protein